MATPAGIAGQFGYKSEATWATAVVVDKFLPFLPGESINKTVQRLESQGIRAGRLVTARWAPGSVRCGGTLTMELPNITIAPILKHMFGTLNTTGAGPYTHTASPGDLTGLSMTWQLGKPDVSGTVQPFTYNGVKITEWDLSAALGEYAKLALTVSAKDETTATGLAVASYAATLNPLTFVQASLTLAGSAPQVCRSFTLKGANSLAADRGGVGTANIAQQLRSGMAVYTGTIDTDFESLTAYNRFINGTETALVLTFSNGTDSLVITMNVRYDGDTPNVADMGILKQPLPFKAVSATADATAITAVLINSDTTAA